MRVLRNSSIAPLANGRLPVSVDEDSHVADFLDIMPGLKRCQEQGKDKK
jgi:hypothetical protein